MSLKFCLCLQIFVAELKRVVRQNKLEVLAVLVAAEMLRVVFLAKLYLQETLSSAMNFVCLYVVVVFALDSIVGYGITDSALEKRAGVYFQ